MTGRVNEETYKKVYERLQAGPIHFNEIKQMIGGNYNKTESFITCLSIKYPIWNPAFGIYKLMSSDDKEYLESIQRAKHGKKKRNN